MKVKYPIALAITFIWIGFLLSISFMESWVKFQAEGVTLPVGLSIGKLVFGILNKLEWLFFIIIISFIFKKIALVKSHPNLLTALFIILILQTFWLLPILDQRADWLIQNQTIASSNEHLYYIFFELIKLVILFIFGISLLKEIATDNQSPIDLT